jgi:hypothetical protein
VKTTVERLEEVLKWQIAQSLSLVELQQRVDQRVANRYEWKRLRAARKRRKPKPLGVRQLMYEPLGSIYNGVRYEYREGSHTEHMPISITFDSNYIETKDEMIGAMREAAKKWRAAHPPTRWARFKRWLQ